VDILLLLPSSKNLICFSFRVVWTALRIWRETAEGISNSITSTRAFEHARDGKSPLCARIRPQKKEAAFPRPRRITLGDTRANRAQKKALVSFSISRLWPFRGRKSSSVLFEKGRDRTFLSAVANFVLFHFRQKALRGGRKCDPYWPFFLICHLILLEDD